MNLLEQLIIERYALLDRIDSLSDIAADLGIDEHMPDAMRYLVELSVTSLAKIGAAIREIRETLTEHGLILPPAETHHDKPVTSYGRYLEHVRTYANRLEKLIDKMTPKRPANRKLSSYQTEFATCNYDC